MAISEFERPQNPLDIKISDPELRSFADSTSSERKSTLITLDLHQPILQHKNNPRLPGVLPRFSIETPLTEEQVTENAKRKEQASKFITDLVGAPPVSLGDSSQLSVLLRPGDLQQVAESALFLKVSPNKSFIPNR